MPGAAAPALPCQPNSRLDSFLKRHTEQSVHRRVRACEPCVVASRHSRPAYMHVMLSDEEVLLAEVPPRTVRPAVRFRDITNIQLVNDTADFLSGRQRELSQHILILHTRMGCLDEQQAERQKDCNSLHHMLLSTSSASLEPVSTTRPISQGDLSEEVGKKVKPRRAESCPNPDLQSLSQPLAHLLTPPLSNVIHDNQTDRRPSLLDKLLKRLPDKKTEEKSEEAELHVYTVSPASCIYLHLQSSWSSYLIRSTLLLEPEYRKRCGLSSSSCTPPHTQLSWERTVHLFSQLSTELLQEGIGLEKMYLLLQELHMAAHRNTALRTLFWRSGELWPFLVRTLEESLQSPQCPLPTADRLLLCTVLAQTLAVMFRETEVEPARHTLLTAQRGSLTEKLLLALVCDPHLGVPATGERVQTQVQTLLTEYLDGASALLFECVLLAQQASFSPRIDRILTVGWMLKTLQNHESILPFMSYQAQQVIRVLCQPAVGPAQVVLLYQRCRLLLATLQHSTELRHHIRAEFKEEFRYYVKKSRVKKQLPRCYPISRPTVILTTQLLHLMLAPA